MPLVAVISNPSEFVGYLLYLSEMLKIKRIGVKRQGDSTDPHLTIHESTRGWPSSIGAKTGGDVVLEARKFKTFLIV